MADDKAKKDVVVSFGSAFVMNHGEFESGVITWLLKAPFVSILCLAFSGGVITDSFGSSARAFTGSAARFSSKGDCDRTPHQIEVPGNDYQGDINRLIALRSHSLDELIALANQMESKWRRINWDHYARVMKYVCSEISNRGLNDPKVREASEHFARVALSHSSHYQWEHEAAIVRWLGYQRSASDDNTWLHERSEKAELWLHAWQRLEKQTDATFDINDRNNQPSMRVYPPVETGLPAGTSPSAIKDARLRAKYETAIAVNKRKSQRIEQQFPLRLYGPSFKAQVERF